MTNVLGKRESLSSKEKYFDNPKLNFLKSHAPELLEESGRSKFFIDYEFPQKQSILKKFWQRCLSLFYRNALKGAIVYWEDLYEFFNIENSYPVGLSKILLELVNDGEYHIVRQDADYKGLNRLFNYESAESVPNEGFWGRLKGLFRSNQPKIASNTIIVNVIQFQSICKSVQSQIDSLFTNQNVLPDEDFNHQFEKIFKLNQVDQHAIIYLLTHMSVLFKRKVENMTFYYLREVANESEIDINAFIQEVFIESKLVVFENKIEEITQSVNSTNRELIDLKKQGRKQEALQLLQKRRMFGDQLEKISSKRLLLSDLLMKLRTTRDERQLTDILQKTNEFFKDKDKHMDLITEALENFQNLNYQSENITNLISDLNKGSDLDDMYNNLEDDIVTEKTSSKKISLEKNRTIDQLNIPLMRDVKPLDDVTHDLDDYRIREKRFFELLE
jgi:hypothetical protein